MPKRSKQAEHLAGTRVKAARTLSKFVDMGTQTDENSKFLSIETQTDDLIEKLSIGIDTSRLIQTCSNEIQTDVATCSTEIQTEKIDVQNKAIQKSLSISYNSLIEPFGKGSAKHCDKSYYVIAQTAAYFEEASRLKLIFTHQGHVEIASKVCGVSRHTVEKAIEECSGKEEMPSCSSRRRLTKKHLWAIATANVPPLIQNHIRLTIHNWYQMGKAVRLRPLLATIKYDFRNEGDDHPIVKMSLSTFSYLLHGLGYTYGRTATSNPMLLERPELREWRRIFLSKIDDYRKRGYFIIYLDETWVFSNMSQRSDWKLGNLHDMIKAFRMFGSAGPRASVERGKRAIVIGAMSQESIITEACEVWIDGKHSEESDYHKEMKANTFEDWFKRSIPKFKAAAKGRPIVTVMDNAAYHGRLVEKPPNVASSKGDIAKFLLDQNVLNGSIEEATSNMKKSELVETLTSFLAENGGKEKFCKRAIEILCSENEMEILRLPPYHCQFNPIEMVWGYAKEKTRNEGFRCGSIQAVKEMFLNWLSTITPDMSIKYLEHVIRIENEYRKEENITENFIEINEDEGSEEQNFEQTNDEDEEDRAVQSLLAAMIEEENEGDYF